MTRVLFFCFCGASFVACGPFAPETESNQYRLVWSDSNGLMEFKTVTIDDGFDRNLLRGPAAKIELDPRLKDGEIVAENPIGRWSQADGIWHPGDLVSLQAGTVYAHILRVRGLSREAGLGTDRMGPLRVGMMTRLSVGRDGFDQKSLLLNNALYDVLRDRIYFVPFSSRASVLPIQLNGGVIAHEYFHRIFAQAVLLPMGSQRNGSFSAALELNHPADCSHGHYGASSTQSEVFQQQFNMVDKKRVEAVIQLQLVVFLRAINEGLADYFAWAYVGDPNFIARSLVSRFFQEARDLSQEPMRFGSLEQATQQFNSFLSEDSEKPQSHRRWKVSPEVVFGYPYEIGTQYGRVLWRTTVGFQKLILSSRAGESFSGQDDFYKAAALKEAQSLMLKAIASSLPKLKDVFESISRVGGSSQSVLEPIVKEALESALALSAQKESSKKVRKASDLSSGPSQDAFQAVCSDLKNWNVPSSSWDICD